MKVMCKVPQTIILSVQEIEASEYISQQLMIDIGEHVYELERLRLADGIPMMLERTYIPASLFDGLTIADLDNTALYEVFSKKYNQFIRMAVEEFYASIALDNEAKLLGVRGNSPVLHLLRKSYNDKNRIIEYTFSIARADQFRYRMVHKPMNEN